MLVSLLSRICSESCSNWMASPSFWIVSSSLPSDAGPDALLGSALVEPLLEPQQLAAELLELPGELLVPRHQLVLDLRGRGRPALIGLIAGAHHQDHAEHDEAERS